MKAKDEKAKSKIKKTKVIAFRVSENDFFLIHNFVKATNIGFHNYEKK